MTDDVRPWHRINQANAQGGAPPVLPEDWADTAVMSDGILDSLCETDQRLDNPTHLEHVFDAESWMRIQEARDVVRATDRDTSFLEDGERARFDVVCMTPPFEPTSVAHLTDYERVGRAKLHSPASTVAGCSAALSVNCQRADHSKLWAHQSGQRILVVAMCKPCRDLLQAGGPMELVCRAVGTVEHVAQGDPDDMDTAINRPDPRSTEDPWNT